MTKLPDLEKSGEYTLTEKLARKFVGEWLIGMHGTARDPATITYIGYSTYHMECRSCKTFVVLHVERDVE